MYYLNRQTFKDFELIFIDDGPEVGILDVLKKQPHFFPIRYYRANRRGAGDVAANDTKVKWLNSGSLTNFAVERAAGEYIIRCDPEMIIQNNGVEEYHNALEKADMFFTSRAFCASESHMEFITKHYTDVDKLWRYITINCADSKDLMMTMAIRKGSFKRVGGIRTGGVGWGGNDIAFDSACKKIKLQHQSLVTFSTAHMHHRRASHYIGYRDTPVTNPTLVEIPGNV